MLTNVSSRNVFFRLNDRDSQIGKLQVQQMLMRTPERNTGQHRDLESGFSLIEMLIVVALIIVMASISFISMVPVLKQGRLNNAYNTTLAALRQARDNAISQRTSYKVTFTTTTTPVVNTIKVEPTLTTFQGAQTAVTYQLPTDIAFVALSGLPSTGPDNYGTGATAIDFGYTANNTSGGATIFYFCPDGSAQDASACAGSWDGGVVYIARAGDLMSSRAITLWGGTGRIHGWRLYGNGSGGYQWLRQ